MQGKHSYFEMIEDAILTLGDRKGSSRQGIWKVISTKYPEADFKQYLIRLKKVKDSDHIEQVGPSRFKLSSSYRAKLLKTLKNGKEVKPIKKTKATMKKQSKRKPRTSTKRSAAMSTKKGSSKRSSSAKSGAKKSGKGGKGRKVAKKNTKAATGKSTRGSKKTQMKKQTKK